MGDNTVEVQIEGDSSDLQSEVGAAQTSLLDLKKAAGIASAAMGALAVGGLAAATNAAADFESAMVEVEKVTNPQVAREMSAAVKDMATTIPLAQSELAGLAADAARFGVEGPENIQNFTETVAKMATATDLGAQQAGESLAKLATLTKTPITQVENLGSAINSLSNNFATSSQEIVDSMLRASASLSQLGLEQTQIAGLSATLNEVSESSERAGTRLRRLAQEIQSPGKQLENMAAAAGLTVTEFKQMRANSPNELIMRLAGALDASETRAKAANKAFSTTSRQALAGLNQNMQAASNATDLASKSFKQATSLQKEFSAQTDTFNAQLQLLKNQLRNAAINIGNVFLPALTDAIAGLREWLAANDTLLGQLSAQQKAWGLVATAVAATGAALVSFAGGPAAVAAGALAALTSPITAVGVAAGALAVAWQRNMFNIRDVTQAVFSAIQTRFNQFRSAAAPAIQTAITAVEQSFRRLQSVVLPVVQNALTAMESIWQAHSEAIMAAARTALSLVQTQYNTAMNIIQQTVQTALSMLTQLWNTHASEITAVVTQLGNTIIAAFKGLLNTILPVIRAGLSSLLAFWRNHGQSVQTVVNGFLTVVLGTFRTIFDLILTTVRTVLNTINGVVRAAMAALRGDFDTALNTILNTARTNLTAMLNFWKRTFTGILDYVVNWGPRIINGIIDILGGVIQAFIDFGNRLIFGSIVKDIFNSIYEFVTGKLSALAEFITGILGTIFNAFSNTLAAIQQTVMSGINAAASAFQGGLNTMRSIADRILGGIVGAFNSALSTISSIANSIISKAENAYNTAQRKLDQARQAANDIGGANDRDPSQGVGVGPSVGDNVGGRGGGGASGGGVSTTGGTSISEEEKAIFAGGLNSGGIVSAGSGLPFMLHGQEAVMPLDKLPGLMADAMAQVGGGGGKQTTIVVKDNEFTGVEDADDVAKELHRELATRL